MQLKQINGPDSSIYLPCTVCSDSVVVSLGFTLCLSLSVSLSLCLSPFNFLSIYLSSLFSFPLPSLFVYSPSLSPSASVSLILLYVCHPTLNHPLPYLDK